VCSFLTAHQHKKAI